MEPISPSIFKEPRFLPAPLACAAKRCTSAIVNITIWTFWLVVSPAFPSVQKGYQILSEYTLEITGTDIFFSHSGSSCAARPNQEQVTVPHTTVIAPNSKSSHAMGAISFFSFRPLIIIAAAMPQISRP